MVYILQTTVSKALSKEDNDISIYILSQKKKRTFFNDLTFCITQHLVTGKLPPSQKALFISSALIVYAFDHIGTIRHGLRNLYDIDSDWDIFSCVGGVGCN